MKHIPHLVTFPRSGSHYFQDIIFNNLGINIDMSHSVVSLFDKDNKKQRTVVTIVRDPIESISSYLALQEASFGPGDTTRTEQVVTEYVLMYSFMDIHADYIIDFKDLINYPESVSKKILTLLEIDKEDYSFFSQEYNVRHPNYLGSSKTLQGYKELSLDEFNIELCYFYYNKLLEKKIVV